MVRPCFLVVDREFSGSISTRKLVIETAKFNVVTAYSGGEALEAFKKFPAVNGVVLDGAVHDLECGELTRAIKSIQPAMPVIAIIPPGFPGCPEADYELESFEPGKLLEILRGLMPEAEAEIERRNRDLSRAERFEGN